MALRTTRAATGRSAVRGVRDRCKCGACAISIWAASRCQDYFP